METAAQYTASAPLTAATPTPSVPGAAVSVGPKAMRAVVHNRYGAPEMLALRSVRRPDPQPTEVLVRVHAAGLHIGDCFAVRGTPFAMRLVTGLLKPKVGIPGFDLAGTVEAVGSEVTRFRPGDAVFGCGNGSCAEFVAVEQDTLAAKPDGLSFEQAAAVPTSALAALHALRDVASLQAGDRVLVNGASGGVGSFAVQLAKSLGAEVTGVCSTKNVEMVRSLGADHVIDYTREDFTEGGAIYDLVFDNIENRSLSDCRRALAPKGMLVLNSGTGATGVRMLMRLLKPLVVSPFVGHTLRRYLSVPNHADLTELAALAESGAIVPRIDKTYALEQTAAALVHIESGRARGKVVVRVGL